MIFASPSATIASLSGSAFLVTLSSNKVAASTTLPSDHASTRTKRKSTECLFEKGFKFDYIKFDYNNADIGVLSCGYGSVCVEDNTSSIGGRCIKIKYVGDYVTSRRQLATDCQYVNGTFGRKCVGIDACYNADETKIGCGSCIGNYTCDSMSGDVTIGEHSCIGYAACYSASSGSGASITIGDGSCHDNVACAFLKSKEY